MQVAHRLLCDSSDMHVFVALLALSHTDRDQAFGELLEMFKNRDCNVVLRAEKLAVSPPFTPSRQ